MSKKRDVYLHEYQDMSFKERLYIVRKNEWKTDWSRYRIENPLDWSLRKIWRAWIKAVCLPVWAIIYWPLMCYSAHELKTRYKGRKDKTWHHSDREVL